MTLSELQRTKSGKFSLDDIDNKIISIKDALDYKKIEINDPVLLKKIINGNKIILNEKDEYIILLNNNKELGIYKKL